MIRKGTNIKQPYARKLLLLRWVVLCLSLFHGAIYADNLIVISKPVKIYKDVAASITANLDTATKTIDLEQLSNRRFQLAGFENVIAVGSRAGDLLFNLLPAEQKLYISFIPKQTYQRLLDKYSGHARIKQKNISAVFLDQPFTRQLNLIKQLLPDANVLATAVGPNSQKRLTDLKLAAAKAKIDLQHTMLEESDNPIHKLQPLLEQADAFLAIADRSVFTRSTAKWILYISYRLRTPLIAFSKKYVDAGALAAVYSSADDIGRSTADIINSGNHQVEGLYPKHFSVALNPTAAKSLRLHLPSEEELLRKLMAVEK